jgi:hypothetical protein
MNTHDLMVTHIEKRFPVKYLNHKMNRYDFGLNGKPFRGLHMQLFKFVNDYFPMEFTSFISIWNLEEGTLIHDC